MTLDEAAGKFDMAIKWHLAELATVYSQYLMVKEDTLEAIDFMKELMQKYEYIRPYRKVIALQSNSKLKRDLKLFEQWYQERNLH